MWIRSQDKNLLIDVKAVTKETSNKVFGWVSGDCYFDIGQYNTEEDVMKVIDMIQNCLGYAVEKYELENNNYIRTENVFQMPQKDEII